MVDLLYCQISLLFFNIPLLHYYINLRSLIICCLFCRYIYIYLYLCISLSCPIFSSEVFETFVILSEILFPIKSPVAYAVLNGTVPDCLAWSQSFWLYLLLKVLFIFLSTSFLIFLAKDKNAQPFTNIWSLGWTE